MKQFFITIFSAFLLLSCSYFEKNYKKEEIQVVDTIVDFNFIDSFPLFPTCDSIPSEEKQKICSQIKLSEHIYASLVTHKFITKNSVNDTILVKLEVAKSGEVSLVTIESSKFIQKEIPKLDSLITDGIKKLPKLRPGIKRGIPVKTEFSLPIILKN
ncbi:MULTISPECIES: hypothetical protein [Flavobacteriaceae]|uniref:TonB C-terminal domain-containing protein n=2 Tax=Flavobacteriaceae TaxID=49546 RepID=A0A4Y8ATQ0_9FLAO|nr:MULTISPECIES: hypothetical protein [Flavobacteriaceae]TEW75271.1 hypothetical protein E2488_07070 [Gramella jeungdoensis]GGK43824.1 hypothetical protein GCM10007963_09980 [Lutibacter litoralis]